MRIGIIDIGSNTARLLVAGIEGGRLERIRERRAFLGLGEAIEQTGALPEAKLVETAALAESYATAARSAGIDVLDVIVTAPGRQGKNGDELVARLLAATHAQVRVISCEEEGRYAYDGAVATLDDGPFGPLAVCDVGGGSSEVVIGDADRRPTYVRSFDLGSMRLTSRFLLRKPDAASVAAAREFVAERLDTLDPPPPARALATGGTARALRRVCGKTLDADRLEHAIAELTSRSPGRVAAAYDLERARARTLLGGAIILAEVGCRLGVPFTVSRGGLREGAALAVARVAQAA